MTRQYCAFDGCQKFAAYRNIDASGAGVYTCFKHASEKAKQLQLVYAKAWRHRKAIKGVSQLRLAYFAGLFDGEGWICITRTRPDKGRKLPSYSLNVGVANTHRGVMDEFRSAFGGRIDTRIDKDGYAPCHHWSASMKTIELFLQAMLPHLLIKREQALIALEFRKSITSIRMHSLDMDEGMEAIAYREQLRSRLRAYRSPKRQKRITALGEATHENFLEKRVL